MGRSENDPFDRSGLPRGEAPRVLPLRTQEGEGAPRSGEDGTKEVNPLKFAYTPFSDHSVLELLNAEHVLELLSHVITMEYISCPVHCTASVVAKSSF